MSRILEVTARDETGEVVGEKVDTVGSAGSEYGRIITSVDTIQNENLDT